MSSGSFGGPVRTGPLLSDAFRLVRQNLLWILGLCAVGGGLSTALAYAVYILGVDSLEAGGGRYLAFLAADALVSSLLAAFAMRLMLRGRRDLLRVDGPLLAATARYAVFVVVILAIGEALQEISGEAQAAPTAYLVTGVLILVTWGLLIFASIRASLWAPAALMGRPEVTFGRSWRLMRGAVGAVFVGDIVLSLLAFGPWLLASTVVQRATGEALVPTVVGQAPGAIATVLTAALEAVVYELRVGAPSTVADVFD